MVTSIATKIVVETSIGTSVGVSTGTNSSRKAQIDTKMAPEIQMIATGIKTSHRTRPRDFTMTDITIGHRRDLSTDHHMVRDIRIRGGI